MSLTSRAATLGRRSTGPSIDGLNNPLLVFDPDHRPAAALAPAFPNTVPIGEGELARSAVADDPAQDRVLAAGIAGAAGALSANVLTQGTSPALRRHHAKLPQRGDRTKSNDEPFHH